MKRTHLASLGLLISGILIATLLESLKPGSFISYSFLFAAIILSLAILFRKSRIGYSLFLIGIIEILLTLSIKGLARAFPQSKIASLQSYLMPHGEKEKSKTEFSILTGRRLLPSDGDHDAFGFRRVPDRSNNYSSQIAIYGGSTTYDVLVDSKDSWPNQLQILLNDSGLSGVAVRNLGMPGASTSEAIVFQGFYDYDQLKGIYPVCSIHYHGWNDLRNNYVPNLDPAYADWHLLNQANRGRMGSKYSSIIALASATVPRIFTGNTIPNESPALNPSAQQKLDKNLVRIVQRNVRTIVALSGKNGGKTLFIPQILNPAKLTEQSRYGWLPNVDDNRVMPLLAELNNIVRITATEMGAIFAEDIHQSKFANDDFGDNGHFNSKGSQKFAGLVYPYLLKCMQGAK